MEILQNVLNLIWSVLVIKDAANTQSRSYHFLPVLSPTVHGASDGDQSQTDIGLNMCSYTAGGALLTLFEC